MPGNIFANTPTSVSIIFLEFNCKEEPILLDASSLGIKIKTEDKKQKVVLSSQEEQRIIKVFIERLQEEDFSVKVPISKISQHNFSFNPGLYFDVKIKQMNISEKAFNLSLIHI